MTGTPARSIIPGDLILDSRGELVRVDAVHHEIAATGEPARIRLACRELLGEQRSDVTMTLPNGCSVARAGRYDPAAR